MDFATGSLTLSPALKDFISGAVAGAFAITISQPLDTVRVRLQQAAHGTGARNAIGVLLGMVRREGVFSPFKGLTYPLLFASVQSAILFQAYGWTLRQLAPPLERQHNYDDHHQQQQPRHAPPSSSMPLPACGLQQTGGGAQFTPNGSTGSSSSSPSRSPEGSALHEFHLHHHHHRLQEREQDPAAVHGAKSLSGQLLDWAWRAAAPSPRVPAGSGAASTSAPLAHPLAFGGTSAAPAEGAAELAVVSCSSSNVCENCSTSSSSGSTSAAAGRRSVARSSAGSGGPSKALSVSIAEGGTSDRNSDSDQRRQQQTAPGRQQQQPGGHAGAVALPTPWHGFLAGSVSGFAQVFLWSPVELLKLRAQLQTASPGSAGYRNPAALARHVLRRDGVAGLYRGFTLTVVRDVPSYAMYFWLYHDIAGALSPGVHPEQAPPSTQVIAGGLAGVIAWLPIYPLDVLKTRVQAVPAADGRGKTWLHFAREMYEEAGARAFFRGVAPTLLRAFVMDGASFLGYTTTLKMLGGSGGGNSGTGREREGVALAASAPAPA